ncbi:hypothetical protein WMY93_000218 [Mugilogobius chulae]|uniref:Uncharacterized protein n=1 Tax=Mugilogobius chulae TaxID=88201 RepID=A0AAW0Q1U5_9GOBI
MKNLQNLMLHNLGSAANQKTWTEDGLFNYCYNIVFRAGYLALYGNATSETEGDKEKAINKDRAESDVLFKEFRKYDQLFPNLAYNVLPPSGRREASRLLNFFQTFLSLEKIGSKNNISGWISDLISARREEGMSESMIERYMFVLLWASQGNTGPSSFWLLLYLMKDPVALKALRKEADKVLKESGQEVRPGGPPVDLTYEMLMKTPVLDSAVEETLRLVAAPLLTRSVLQDMTLNMANGRQFFIRKGDRMAVFPYIAVHIDPEIHPDPHTFKYDRFLTQKTVTRGSPVPLVLSEAVSRGSPVPLVLSEAVSRGSPVPLVLFEGVTRGSPMPLVLSEAVTLAALLLLVLFEAVTRDLASEPRRAGIIVLELGA